MICSLSGQVAQEPVVTKNGDIFEKRLILKHIETNGTCPITNEPLSPEDLISVRVTNPNAVKPRQLSSTSIPGLLQTFQNEWDALMLETFNLKNNSIQPDNNYLIPSIKMMLHAVLLRD